ncbi:MAG: hypothetical protein Q8N80_06150 [Candidatus Omnitrophota bacterium]|nr:hypothetical protein [Candidatus Omnitrophota bacterium]
MKYWNRFFLLAICCLLSAVLSGCATVKEMGKGFIGVSTQVLEEKRKDALKKSFVLDYDGCYVKVKEILKGNVKEKESPVYAEDAKKKMIAVYLTQIDTTPVGIFFTEEPGGNTLIEISSPSIYAKEEIANRIFTGIDELIKPKVEEKKINVKEKSGN